MLKYKKLCFLHNPNLVLYIIIRFNLKKYFHFDAKGIFTMFITTEMFLQKFKQYHPIYPFYKLKNSKIKAPLHYNGKNLKNNYLYLISADDLGILYTSAFLICLWILAKTNPLHKKWCWQYPRRLPL